MKFIESLQTEGPSAIGPLENTRYATGLPVFYAAINGCPILKNGKFGPESSFESEESAINFAIKYAEQLKGFRA